MQLQEFCALAQQGYNRIPLTKVVLADLDTPVSAYAKLASGAYSFLFESVQGGEKWGRYSIIGLPCRVVMKAFGERVEVHAGDELLEAHTMADPLEFVETFAARYKVPALAGMPAFFGGLVGYFAYDAVRYVEPRLKQSAPPDSLAVPDILLMLSDDVLVFDNLASKIHIVTHVDVEAGASDAQLAALYQQATAQLDTLATRLRNQSAALSAIDVSSTTAEEQLAEG
ncbi:MAG: anthranilate synthase component I, partial [Pseudomonadales bacterium]|nr:anthranilate synthase component I [Pseudomonadales bacterium]